MPLDEYKVELDAYSGPLDLLLYLVRRDEVDIARVSLARIAGEYLRHVELLQTLRVDVAGEFLVVAATLMELKSRALLPAPPELEEEEWEDPCEELLLQLLEYRRFKEAALALDAHAEEHSLRFPRPGERLPEQTPEGEAPAIEVSLWDLIDAFGRLLEATGQTISEIELTTDETPLEAVAERILRTFDDGRAEATLADLLPRPFHRGMLVSLVLALLELVKQGAVRLIQREPFGEIRVVRRSDAPASAAIPAARPDVSANDTPQPSAP